MDLLDRYLQAVKFWLPKSQKKDIIAELAEDIHSHIDDKAGELGRGLTEDELEAVLKRYGPPMIVAERYLPQRHLIGPLLYPIYRFVLKLVALVYLVPWFLVWLFLVAFIPSYRAAHPGPDLLKTLSTLWNIAFYSFGFITVAFAIAERVHVKSKYFERWNPRKLPVVRDPYKIPRGQSIVEIVCGALFALWWVNVLRFPVVIIDSAASVRWTLGPVWENLHHGFYYPFLVLGLAGAVTAAFNLARPTWTRLRLGIRAAMDAVAAVLLGFVLSAHWLEVKAQLAIVSASRAQLSKAELLADWTNIGVSMSLAVALIILFLTCLRGILRILRWDRIERQSAPAAQSR